MHHSARRLLLPLVAVASLVGATAATVISRTINQTCSADGHYSDGSPYGNNVADLLSNLTDPAAAADNWWFRRATVGAAPDQAFGLAMCFADSDPAQCRDCFAFFTSRGDMCDHGRNVRFVSTQGCVMRYADAPFFGSAAAGSVPELIISSSTSHVADDSAAAVREARRAMLSQLAEMAGGEALRLATGSEWIVGGSLVVYGMVQCTRDLPASECTRCLLDLLAAGDVGVTNSTGASVMGYSCYLRYQMGEPIHIAGNPPQAGPPTGGSATPPIGKMPALAAAAVTLLSVIGV